MSPKIMDGGVRRPERKDSLDPVAHEMVQSDVRVTMAGTFPTEQSSSDVPIALPKRKSTQNSHGSSVSSKIASTFKRLMMGAASPACNENIEPKLPTLIS
jgi:hypothetical protein